MSEIVVNPECIDCPVMRECRLFFKNTRKSKFKRKFEYVPAMAEFTKKWRKKMTCMKVVK